MEWFHDKISKCSGWSASTGPWRIYRKLEDMVDPGPSNTFVFLDEREDSINDGMFVVDMGGYPDKPAMHRMVDIPASYHGGGGGFWRRQRDANDEYEYECDDYASFEARTTEKERCITRVW